MSRSRTSAADRGGVRRINSYAWRWFGIILGLDTDTPETADTSSVHRRLADPIRRSTPVRALRRRRSGSGWPARAAARGPPRESNVRSPAEETVLEMCGVIRTAYTPEFLHARYAYNQRHTVRRRRRFPLNPAPPGSGGASGAAPRSPAALRAARRARHYRRCSGGWRGRCCGPARGALIHSAVVSPLSHESRATACATLPSRRSTRRGLPAARAPSRRRC